MLNDSPSHWFVEFQNFHIWYPHCVHQIQSKQQIVIWETQLYLWLVQHCNKIQERAELCAKAIYFYLFLNLYLYLCLKQQCNKIQERVELCAKAIYFTFILIFFFIFFFGSCSTAIRYKREQNVVQRQYMFQEARLRTNSHQYIDESLIYWKKDGQLWK